MLMLNRKNGESIFFRDINSGETFKMKVLFIKGNQVLIGIDAPQNINIYRAELSNMTPKKD